MKGAAQRPAMPSADLAVMPVQLEDGRVRAVIENVQPAVDGGRFAIKRVIGDTVVVEADCFADGHDVVAARLQWRQRGAAQWRYAPMAPLVNDRWRAGFVGWGRGGADRHGRLGSARLPPGHPEQLVHQPLRALDAGFKLGKTLRRCALGKVAAQVLQLQTHRCDRCAQLMRGVLHKTALRDKGIAQTCQQAVERDNQRRDFVRHAVQRQLGNTMLVLDGGLARNFADGARHHCRHAPENEDRQRQQDN